MRAKTINENYPIGAENDPNAPWNQEDDFWGNEFIVDLNQYGEVALSYNDNDKNTTIDPYYMDEFLADKLYLDFEELEENGETIEIKDIVEIDNKMMFYTDKGVVTVDYDELEELAQ